MKKLIILFLFAAVWISNSVSQDLQNDNPKQMLFKPTMKHQGAVLDLSTYKSPKRPGHYTTEDWHALVDSLWGPGEPTSTKLEIFDFFWNAIDQKYGGFPYITVNWDSMKTLYRPEIEAGVSRGRFWGIMGQLYLALQEIHTFIFDGDLDSSFTENGQMVYKPGVPAFHTSGWGWAGNFGAALTPLPDSSLLVYRAISPHPLGLVPGDIVLGYDRIPWKQLYKDLLSAQLPLKFWPDFGYGSSPRSMTHALLNSAGNNWGLFDSLDVVKYDTGDTLHLPTAPLTGLDWNSLFATEQVAVPGIQMPDYVNGEHVTWGVVDNTSIGYVYVYRWYYADELVFEAVLKDLINVKKVTGLILDYRYNLGDGSDKTYDGLDYLFNENPAGASRWRSATRSDPANHLSFTYSSPPDSAISMRPDYYDRPIAVLNGPQAWSYGDYTAFRMRFHPMVRFFGLPTNGAFVTDALIWVGPVWGNWNCLYSTGQMQSLVNNEGFLLHKSFPVDEEIWLTRDDVAKGEDTVVKRAIEWINNLSHAHNVSVDPTFVRPNADTVTISAIVANPNQHPVTVLATLTDDSSAVLDSMYLYDDGLHHDGKPGDKVWANSSSCLNNSEQTVHVSIVTDDPIAGDTRRLSNAVQFTSIGPLVFDGIRNISTDQEVNPGDKLKFYFKVRNNGSTATAMDVMSQIIPLDTCAYISSPAKFSYGNIAPGTSVEGTKLIQPILFNKNCGDCTARFALEIYSSGYHFWSDTFAIDIVKTGIREHEVIVKEFNLKQNYPNPFNPITTISYQLPLRSHVLLRVYDVQGREVTTLVNGVEQPGDKSVILDAESWSSGIYYYRLQAGSFVQTRKLVLLK
jgi:hypothetical protein